MKTAEALEARSESRTLGGIVRHGVAALAATSDSPVLDAELLLAHAANCARSVIRAFPERVVGAADAAAFDRLIERRRAGEPVAYLLGEREFYSLPLRVTGAVLVPRPETELLVELAVSYLPPDSDEAVLDLGTGSGAIALAIKHERRRAHVTAVDVSCDALAVARDNAAALGLEVELLESDWFAALGRRQFALIVANPPYVASDDPALRAALRHEPRLALDGGSDGLDAVRAILDRAQAHLTRGGRLLIEHGEAQARRARQIAAAQGYTNVRSVEDLAGHERVLVTERPR